MQRFRILILTVVLLVLQSPVVAQKLTTTQQLEEAYEQARDLFVKEKYASAQQRFDALVRKAGGGTSQMADNAAYYAAVCASKLDNNDAEYRLKEFLKKYPQSSHRSMANFHLGNFYYKRGKGDDYTTALKYYESVDRQNIEYGNRGEYDFKRAYCYFTQEKYAKAKPLFAQQINTQSKFRNASLYYYAHIQYLDKEYDLALKNFEQLASDKNFAKLVPSYKARLYYYLGRDDELLELAPSMLADEDVYKRDEIMQMVAEVYYNRGEYENALRYYRQMPATDSKQCSPQDNYYQMGYCYYMTSQIDSAAICLEKKTLCDDSVSQNALYTLGDIYVRQNRKDDARSMFLQASKMNYDKKIQEDALFNYAKLSCELNKNPYNESIRSFQDYLKKYPNTSHRAEIQEILASLYLTTRNYKDALTLIEKIPDRSVALNKAYQRIVMNRGIEIFNGGNVAYAAEYFQKAARLNVDPAVTTDANFLYGESQYRMENYEAAARSIDKFLLSSGASESPYYLQGLYTQGYLSMRQKQYGDAAHYFNKFLNVANASAKSGSQPVSKHQICDVYNRLGDCKYVNSAFSDAIPYYDYVINANDKDADYATYQKAMSYGALGDLSGKLNNLNYIFERYQGSQLSSKAQLEIANSYLVCDNEEMALLYYSNFIKKYPNSVYVKEALLNMGIIYYNSSRNEQALNTFDQLLTEYPGTPESRDALATVKNIYIKENRVDEYFNYVKKRTQITISTMEQDSTTYMAAEDRYMEGAYEQAATNLENYLKQFPNGLFSLQANYYAADAYFRLGKNDKALPHFEKVASAAKNQFTESALFNGASIAFNAKDYDRALPLYQSLESSAESDNGMVQGMTGTMRCLWNSGMREEALSAARRLSQCEKAGVELREEALLLIARNASQNGDLDSADYYYGQLVHSTNGEYSGEATFRKAEILFLKEKRSATNTKKADAYKKAEKAIEGIIANPTSDYWLAKSFILWADIYAARGNKLQAKQTLQSIIDNYDGEELVAVATEKRDAIIASEQPPQQSDDDAPVIEL